MLNRINNDSSGVQSVIRSLCSWPIYWFIFLALATKPTKKEKSSLIYWATVQNICLIPRCLKCYVHVENTTAGDQGVSRNGQWVCWHKGHWDGWARKLILRIEPKSLQLLLIMNPLESIWVGGRQNIILQSTLSTTDTFGTGTKCPS